MFVIFLSCQVRSGVSASSKLLGALSTAEPAEHRRRGLSTLGACDEELEEIAPVLKARQATAEAADEPIFLIKGVRECCYIACHLPAP